MCLILCSAGCLAGHVEYFNVIQTDVSICAGLVEAGQKDQLGKRHGFRYEC